MFNVIFLCAGNQTRFNSKIPKILSKINYRDTILDHNINQLPGDYIHKIYILSSFENYEYFKKYDNVIPVKSGTGSAGALYEAYDKINNEYPWILIWGDVILKQNQIIETLQNYKDGVINVPTCFELNGYTQIYTDENMIVTSIKYKNLNETDSDKYALHDLSFFLFEPELFYDNYLTIGCQNFLDLYITKTFEVTYISKDKSLSFNTVEEFKQIKKNLNVLERKI